MYKFLLLALVAFLTGACSYTDEGEGSKTLAATAKINYDFAANDFAVLVQLQKNNEPLSEATITLAANDGSSEATYTLEAIDGSSFNYQLHLDYYPRWVKLSAEHDSDKFWVQLEGPAHSVIVGPEQNGRIVYRKDKKLKVEWRASDGLAADEVRLLFANANSQHYTDDDIGAMTIKMESLVPGHEILTMQRCNLANIGGGKAGSTIEMCYQVSNYFQLYTK